MQWGVCTERVRDKLVRADCHGQFRWERAAAQLGAIVGANESSEDVVPAPDAVPVAVALTPVSVPITIGVRAGQRQVVAIPTEETELQYIRAHAGIFNAPRGKRSVRRRNGSILKADLDPEVLFLYVLEHVSDW